MGLSTILTVLIQFAHVVLGIYYLDDVATHLLRWWLS
jgi:hypothetical protein